VCMWDGDASSSDMTAVSAVLATFACLFGGIVGLALSVTAPTIIAVPAGIVSVIAILLGAALALSILWSR